MHFTQQTCLCQERSGLSAPYKPTNIPSKLKRFSKKQQQRNDYVGRGWRLCERGYLGEGVIEVVKKQWQQLNHDVDVQKANPSVSVCVNVFEDYVVLRLDFLRDLLVREERADL